MAVESVLISYIAALDHVQAGDATSSAEGEGLAGTPGTGAYERLRMTTTGAVTFCGGLMSERRQVTAEICAEG